MPKALAKATGRAQISTKLHRYLKKTGAQQCFVKGHPAGSSIAR
jgi:hypothetical protein